MPPRKRTVPAAETAPTTTERARAAVARRTAAEPAPPAEDGSVDATTADPNIGTIDFYGRAVQVQRPTQEQIVVWNLFAKRLAMVNAPDAIDQQGALDILTRGIELIEAIMVEQADRTWLEHQLLEGVITLEKAFDIIHKTVDSFVAQNEAADKPVSAGQRARARRR